MTALAEVTILAIVVFDIALAPQNGVVLVVVHETMPHEEGGAKATPATHKKQRPSNTSPPTPEGGKYTCFLIGPWSPTPTGKVQEI